VFPIEELPRVDLDTAKRAEEEAREVREQVQQQNGYIEWLSRRLLAHGKDNHFSELIIESMRRKHP
jgi:hypothetical protein